MTVHKVIFYPVGNGDTSQIVLDNGQRILFDFRHLKSKGADDPHIDLNWRLREELKEAEQNYFDVVAFTHGDEDHIAGSTDFFELRHAKKYQGGDRIKINELWVPAAMILEEADNDKQSEESVILRQEARYRLKKGEGIQVFSKPDMLKDWLKKNGLSLEERKHLITDAGCCAEGFTLKQEKVEFFCHSPFIKHCDDGDDLRNSAALIFQIRFWTEGEYVNYFAIGDSTCDVLEDIVDATEGHKNEDRLDWDLFNVPHHCSYHALSEDKGEKETIPTAKVKKLLLHGQAGAYMVSSSDPIDDDEEARQQKQPPHIQAKKAYERYLKETEGRKFLVTMERPSREKPQPLVFKISRDGIRIVRVTTPAAAIVSSSARAG